MEFNNRLLLKIIELVFTISCIIILESLTDKLHASQTMLVCGTVAGYLIICSSLLIGHILGAPLDKRIDILFSIAGCIMFISTGGVLIDHWRDGYMDKHDSNAIVVAGSMCVGIAIACIVLAETVGSLSNNNLIVFSAIGGYTVICGVLLIGHLIGSIVEKRLNALFSIIGCILFVVAGALVIDAWHDQSELLFKERKRNALAAGSLMIINAAVFLLDTLSICRTRTPVPVIKEPTKTKYDVNRF